jgi:hypothetical protein
VSTGQGNRAKRKQGRKQQLNVLQADGWGFSAHDCNTGFVGAGLQAVLAYQGTLGHVRGVCWFEAMTWNGLS